MSGIETWALRAIIGGGPAAERPVRWAATAMRAGVFRVLALFPGCPLLALALLVLGEFPIPFAEETLGWQFGEFGSLTQGKSLTNGFIEPVIAAAFGGVAAGSLWLACRRGAITTARGANLGVVSGLVAVVSLYFAMPLLPE